MTNKWPVPIEGGCGCGALRYRLNRSPIVIHCCNCESCQRETGSAFALNLVVEADQVTLLPRSEQYLTKLKPGEDGTVTPSLLLMPSESGQGQLVARCPRCFIAVWSHYAGAGPWISFIRGGTLDKVGADGTKIDDFLRPDMYIFTRYKQSWVVYPKGEGEKGKVVDEFYDPKDHWPEEARARFEETREKTTKWIERGRSWDVLGNVVDLR